MTFDTGDCLIEVTTWAGLTVCVRYHGRDSWGNDS